LGVLGFDQGWKQFNKTSTPLVEKDQISEKQKKLKIIGDYIGRQ